MSYHVSVKSHEVNELQIAVRRERARVTRRVELNEARRRRGPRLLVDKTNKIEQLLRLEIRQWLFVVSQRGDVHIPAS